MNITPAQAQKLLNGNHTFSQLGFSMLITRLKGAYAEDPSEATLQKCVTEINAFLNKYLAIIAADLAVISKL